MDNFDLKKYLTENKLINEQADHVAPMVVKAYKEYLEAKKNGDGGKEYRYYSKKLNNTYSTRADRDAIEAILKKKYGSALEEQDVVTKMTDFGPIDTPNTGKYLKKSPEEMTMRELERKIEQLENSKFSNENARELMALRSEYSYRTHFKNESLNEGFEKSAIQKALKNNGYNLKQKDFKVSSKKSNIKGNITHYYLNGEEIGNSEYNYDEFISKATKRIKENPKKYSLNESLNEGKGRDEARKIINHLRSKVFKNLNDDELEEFKKEIANAFDIKESINEDIQSELDKWEGRLYDLENMTKSSNNSDPIKHKKTIEGVKKKIASLKKKSEMNEIKGFEEFKETGFKLGDKVEFIGSAHPTHTKPIKLTGTIEYFEPADEIGVRVDGYGKFIPFFKIFSSIELIKEEQVMKKETIANNFRKELIQLLKKHNAELSIDSDSGGSVDLNFDIKDSNGEFIASDAWLASTTNGIITVKDVEKTFQIEDY